MANEAEMPGVRVTPENLKIIANRYYFAGEFIHGDVLEVGCGAGIGIDYLANRSHSYIAGDVSTDNLRLCHGDILRMNAECLPFRKESFNSVVALAVTNYLDMVAFIREVRRVLKVGGILIFTTPNPNQPNFVPSPMSKAYYSAEELESISPEFEHRFWGAWPIESSVRKTSHIASISKAIRTLPLGIKMADTLGNKLLGMKTLSVIDETTCEYVSPIQATVETVERFRVIYGVFTKN